MNTIVFLLLRSALPRGGDCVEQHDRLLPNSVHPEARVDQKDLGRRNFPQDPPPHGSRGQLRVLVPVGLLRLPRGEQEDLHPSL